MALVWSVPVLGGTHGAPACLSGAVGRRLPRQAFGRQGDRRRGAGRGQASPVTLPEGRGAQMRVTRPSAEAHVTGPPVGDLGRQGAWEQACGAQRWPGCGWPRPDPVGCGTHVRGEVASVCGREAVFRAGDSAFPRQQGVQSPHCPESAGHPRSPLTDTRRASLGECGPPEGPQTGPTSVGVQAFFHGNEAP